MYTDHVLPKKSSRLWSGNSKPGKGFVFVITVNSKVFHKLKKKDHTIILIGDISINIENKKFLEEGKFLEDRNIIIVGHSIMNDLIIHFDFANKRIGIIK